MIHFSNQPEHPNDSCHQVNCRFHQVIQFDGTIDDAAVAAGDITENFLISGCDMVESWLEK